MLILSFLQSFTGGPGLAVSCELSLMLITWEAGFSGMAR